MNESASALGRMAKDKRKTMSRAAILQRRRAGQANREAWKRRKAEHYKTVIK